METYTVIKFNREGENEIVAEGLTRDEAKELCKGEESHGEGWFLGFTAE
jgi:hypothetical protein